MHRGDNVGFWLNLRLFISVWLNHNLGTENYRSDISLYVLKCSHNMWIQSPLIDFHINAEFKGERHSNKDIMWSKTINVKKKTFAKKDGYNVQ